MADFVHMPIDEMEAIWAGGFKRAAGSLGVESFGLGVVDLPPDFNHAPKHAHTFDGQEEIYFLLGGSGWLEVNDERIELSRDQVIRVGPTATRRGIAGPEGVRQMIVGAMPGRAYERIPAWEPGAAEPMFTDLPGVKAAHEHESSDDFTVMRVEDMDPAKHPGITVFPVRRALGVVSVGVNIFDLQPNPDAEDGTHYPRHDHASSGQEEVYVPIAGSGEIEIELDGERFALAVGEMVRVGPTVQRKLFPSDDGLRFIAIGGVPGEAYEPPAPRGTTA